MLAMARRWPVTIVIKWQPIIIDGPPASQPLSRCAHPQQLSSVGGMRHQPALYPLHHPRPPVNVQAGVGQRMRVRPIPPYPW
jgi:hypothetical protein